MVKVIKNKVLGLSALVAGLMFPIIMPAQDLPLMPADASVHHSVFPNGLGCYVAANPYVRGFADYAVVSRSEDAVVLSIRDALTADPAVVDSALVRMMFCVDSLGTPADLAVVACGDLDAGEVMKKLKYMSYMIPSSEVMYEDGLQENTSEGPSEVVFDVRTDTLNNMSSVCARWHSPRTPRHLMNTVQTAVYDKAVHELGTVVCGRVGAELRRRGIPSAGVDFRHSGSLSTRGDETFYVEVRVKAEDGAAAEGILRQTLASVDAHGASADELMLAEGIYFDGLQHRSAGAERTNDAYMQMCVRAWLRNGPLSSSKESLAFHASKSISPDMREQVFAGIASALLDMDDDSTAVACRKYMNLSDTLSFPGVGPKVSLRSSRKEPMSGGVIWTFSNGFKVIYRKMPSGGKLHYAYAVSGGYASVPDLEKGEGAFMSDYLGLCNISGMKARDFLKVLRLSGLTMEAHVNLSNVVISGQVKDARSGAGLMMKSLLAVMNTRTPDRDAFSYYAASERLRLASGPADIRTVVDSLMCPGYMYSSCRSQSGITEGLAAKAEGLFEKMASRTNDGVLILVGDMDEAVLRKTITPYIGGFRTWKGLPARMGVQYQPLSGSMTYMAEDGNPGVTIAMSARLPMTADNHVAAEMAAMSLQETVNRALEPLGLRADIDYARRIYPEERFSVMLTVEGDCGGEALELLRQAVASSPEKVDADHVAACRKYLKHAHSVRTREPSWWLYPIAMRYLDGKDYTSYYDDKVDAVDASDVAEILSLLCSGSRIEYIVNVE